MAGEIQTKRVAAWHHGGLASASAAMCTHPLDLLKVHLQTQQKAQIGLLGMGKQVVRSEGILGLYNGISASIGRQMTYSLTRFAVYEYIKGLRTTGGRSLPFHEKVLIAAGAGGIGGFVGTPCDMINVRLQNDMKIARELRRNYKHVFDGLYKIARYEGVTTLFNGAAMASTRAVLVTIGQVAMYDQFKQMFLSTSYFTDNMTTHFTASICAASVATLLTQPVDVMKTRMMNAEPGTYSGIGACARDISSNGLAAFYKGFIPAFTRLGPQTVLTFLFFEQFRLRFGRTVPV
ncbi:mitochondrial dicarboxylate carrier-like [Watersipora subatra]|uniref:mitochondrial dicarboxylate carrier-like n=1 Tax=Watersipora subatra TaxID=2589382 RepID=UPI00355C8223